MKRLIVTTLVTLGFVFAQVGSAAAAARYWKVDIFDPAASTVNRTLNITYNVFSTLPEDNDFTVELFENSVSKGTQTIDHANGDSGAFSINIPANGTYTYKVVATNVDAAGETKESETKTVQVVDGPAPNVVTVNNASAAGGSGSGSGVPGDANGDGVVDDQAAVVAVQGAQDDAKDDEAVQGAQKTEGDKNDSNQALWWAVVVGLVLLGGAYYMFRIRRANQA